MFQSNALWPDGVCHSKYGDNISCDKHATKEMAEGVCEGLQQDGFGGEGKHFPIKTWVSPVQDPPRLPVRRAIELVGTGVELELSKVTVIKQGNFEAIHLDKLPDGTWRLTYSLRTIPDITQVTALKLIREG